MWSDLRQVVGTDREVADSRVMNDTLCKTQWYVLYRSLRLVTVWVWRCGQHGERGSLRRGGCKCVEKYSGVTELWITGGVSNCIH